MKNNDYITYWNSRGDYGKERVKRMLARKEKRKNSKKSNYTCDSCRRNVGYYLSKVVNPYYEDIYGTIIYERLCGSCYDAAMGDI
ncbi:MAG: hypothetical protein ACOC1K_08110 [Nanoarchaeota archaeon]